jgi:site-specific recombinase XerD
MITVENAIQEFLTAVRIERKPKTVETYTSILRPLSTRLYGVQLDQVRVNSIREYLADVRDQKSRFQGAKQRPEQPGGLSIETIRSRVRTLRRFFNWCVSEYDLPPTWNPMKKIAMPSSSRPLPKAISLDDLRALLTATDDTLRGRRDRAMIAFLADTGCRAGGMLSRSRS